MIGIGNSTSAIRLRQGSVIIRSLAGTGLAAAALLLLGGAGAPIDRHALVSRHDVIQKKVDPHAPVMLGNGSLGFTADITGLQTFPDAYAKQSPLLTMAQWAWHSFPNPNGYTARDGEVLVDVPGRGKQPYSYIRDFAEIEQRPALAWLRENPHRFSLGRVALVLRDAKGRPAKIEALSETEQKLDLWTGTLTSRFRFDGQMVTVETRVDTDRDLVRVRVTSPLVAAGRVAVDVRYPGVARQLNPDPSDWSAGAAHLSTIVAQQGDAVKIDREIDDTRYRTSIQAPGGRVTAVAAHQFRASAPGKDRLDVVAGFEREAASLPAPDNDAAAARVAGTWRDYWSKGGMIDFSGSTDPRAAELERRVVLSQYLAAINEAGEVLPQEEGLFSNSWNGKFHLEMHGWHAAHFAQWGRAGLLDRSMGWYVAHLDQARDRAKRHGVEGAWWPKMAGPAGDESPSPINPFIMWQQPHPIYLAEMLYRADGDRAAIDRYGALVDATADLLASWPLSKKGRLMLGPPIVPVQENHPPLTTTNPAFELEYFRWGLATAQAWRERRGLPRKPAWDRVIAGLPAPAMRDGLYLPVETAPGFWKDTMSAACSGNAVKPPCLNRDHPSFLMAYGLIGGGRVSPQTMRNTLAAVRKHWDIRQTWGWDFPMIAMTAARLGEREAAVSWLFEDTTNNRWGVTGMTPRVELAPEERGGPDGDGYKRMADTYFPSNGSLLLAVGMMAAGWEGAEGAAPGFPKQGWVVRAEGIKPLP